MDFINKFARDRQKDKLFKVEKEEEGNNLFRKSGYLEINIETKVFLIVLIIFGIYYFFSQIDANKNVHKELTYVYFLHYHFAGGAGFLLPFYYALLNLISLIIALIFGVLIYFVKDKRKLVFNIWFYTQFMVQETAIISLYTLEAKPYHTIWSFCDSLLLWNLLFLILVPAFTILLFIKLFYIDRSKNV